MNPGALIDSNVVVAAVADTHEHHVASLAVLNASDDGALAVADHSYAEAYVVLTRRGVRAAFEFTAQEAWAALESMRAVTTLVGLTANQTFDSLRDYARIGGVSVRLYDKLIGETAVVHAIPTIVTWNARHMQSLFPRLKVATPPAFMSSIPAS